MAPIPRYIWPICMSMTPCIYMPVPMPIIGLNPIPIPKPGYILILFIFNSIRMLHLNKSALIYTFKC